MSIAWFIALQMMRWKLCNFDSTTDSRRPTFEFTGLARLLQADETPTPPAWRLALKVRFLNRFARRIGQRGLALIIRGLPPVFVLFATVQSTLMLSLKELP
ncbi:MAG: hypothetical protein Q8J94_09340 [Thiobacillus sp.]|nr:hypothetical protein [Thiobacillus sp.]